MNANLPRARPEATKRGQTSGYVVTNSLSAEPLSSGSTSNKKTAVPAGRHVHACRGPGSTSIRRVGTSTAAEEIAPGYAALPKPRSRQRMPSSKSLDYWLYRCNSRQAIDGRVGRPSSSDERCSRVHIADLPIECPQVMEQRWAPTTSVLGFPAPPPSGVDRRRAAVAFLQQRQAALTSGMPRPRLDTTALAALCRVLVLALIVATWFGRPLRLASPTPRKPPCWWLCGGS